jgi:hypothetical protein
MDALGGTSLPPVALSALGSHPVMRFTAASLHALDATLSGSVAQPWTVDTVAKRTGDYTTEQHFFGASGCAVGYKNTADSVFMYAGSAVSATATDNVWHSLTFVGNGASGKFFVDGSSSTVNGGVNGFDANVGLGLAVSVGLAFTGDMVELGVWDTAIGGSEGADLSSNKAAYWGY